jgi:hypothetical protein
VKKRTKRADFISAGEPHAMISILISATSIIQPLRLLRGQKVTTYPVGQPDLSFKRFQGPSQWNGTECTPCGPISGRAHFGGLHPTSIDSRGLRGEPDSSESAQSVFCGRHPTEKVGFGTKNGLSGKRENRTLKGGQTPVRLGIANG